MMVPSFVFSSKIGKKAPVAVFLVDCGKKLTPQLSAVDKKSGGIIKTALLGLESFKGKSGEVLPLFLPRSSGFQQALLVGVGEDGDTLAGERDLRIAGGKAMAALKTMGEGAVFLFADHIKENPEAIATFVEGMRLRAYSFKKYKSKGETTELKGKETKKVKGASDAKDSNEKQRVITVLCDKPASVRALAEREALVVQGVFLARDLVNEPPNVLYPQTYAALVQKELKPLGVQVEIFDEKQLERLGFGAHLAVGKGSARPPRLVVMHWKGEHKKKSASGPVALVGKGITFDTGGISIKPAAGMDEMKMDMGGSAAVVGAMRALAATHCPHEVVGVIALAENMPSDRAYRPGDIVTSLSGKTIEILNTDAEGRLVLCDSLTYVQRRYKPSVIVDLATLTGAIIVALGGEYAGVFANDSSLWEDLSCAGGRSGEKLWRMPLDSAYREEMKSRVADLKNIGDPGRSGGACSAAGFLEHFIEGKTPWAHIDIAGTAWSKSDKSLLPSGGTGFGVRLLYDFVMTREKEQSV